MGRHKDRIRAHYEPRIRPDRPNYDVVSWCDEASQRARFQVLVDNVELRGKSLLDVGCGLGDLWSFLQDRGIAVDYTGVDLLEKMVEAAHQRNTGGRYLCADIFAGDIFGGARFDVVFSSGVFSLDVGNNREFLPAAIARMFELCRDYLVFNLLDQRCGAQGDFCVYFHPDEVLNLLAPFPCESRVIDGYLPNDFTVICRRCPPAGGM